MGIMVIFLIMGSAGFISSTVEVGLSFQGSGCRVLVFWGLESRSRNNNRSSSLQPLLLVILLYLYNAPSNIPKLHCYHAGPYVRISHKV